jgi:hypothetical protein
VPHGHCEAILVACGGEEVWVPTSQVHEDSEVYKPGTEGILVIPQWVAEMKELPYRETKMKAIGHGDNDQQRCVQTPRHGPWP